MKYQDKELQECLRAFSSYSEDELIRQMQKTNPECAPHIAAKILLNKSQNKKHRLILIIAALTLLVALLTLFVAVADFSWNHVLSSPNTNQKKQGLKPNIESQKTKSTNAAPQQKAVPSMQRQSHPNKTK
jgi:hypothetical protein